MISKQLSGPPKPASASATIGANQSRRGAAFHMLDLVGALERLVDLAREIGTGIGRIERLVRVHGAGDVRVGRDLPAGEIDRLQAGADHLHGLVAGERAKRPHRLLLRAAAPTASAHRGGRAYARCAPSRAASARLVRCGGVRCRRSGRSGPSPLVRSRSFVVPSRRVRAAQEPSRPVNVPPKRAELTNSYLCLL